MDPLVKQFDGLAIADYAVILLYLAAVFGAGFLFTKNNQSGKDFFVGGNRIPWWAAGVSLYMSTFSAWMFTGAASFVYNTGWFGFLYFAIKPAGFVVGFLLAAVRWRRARISSPVEFVEERYNHRTRVVIGVVMIISMMYWPGQHLASVARIAAPAIFPGSEFAVSGLILFFGVFVLIYSVAGGIWAVSMTDVLQFIVLLSVCTVLLVVIFWAPDIGGMVAALQTLPAIEWSHSYRPGTTYTHWYIIGFVVAGIFGNVVGDKAQRFFLVRDEKAVKKTGWLAIALFFSSPLLFGIPPLIGKVLWPEAAQLVAFAGGSKPDESIFIAVVIHYLPAGIIGLFIAAMIAASMSALDSVWNTVSSIVSIDLYRGHFRPEATQRELLWVGRIVVVFLAISAITMALLIVNSSLGIFTIGNMVLGLVGIPVTIPLMVGLVSRVPCTWAAIPSILSGIIVAAITRFVFNWTLGPQYLAVIGTALVVLLVSRWLGRLHLRNPLKAIAGAGSIGVAIWMIGAWLSAPTMDGGHHQIIASHGPDGWWLTVAALSVIILNLAFTPLYSREEADPPTRVDEFFARISHPIDVAREVDESTHNGRPNRIIGVSTLALAGVPLLLMLVYGMADAATYLALSIILAVIGGLFFRAGES
jgi:solute:Na+ symporter, SSS family